MTYKSDNKEGEVKTETFQGDNIWSDPHRRMTFKMMDGLPCVFWTSVKYTQCDSFACSGLQANAKCYSSEANCICTIRQTVLAQKYLVSTTNSSLK
jgi:hypothetical protein